MSLLVLIFLFVAITQSQYVGILQFIPATLDKKSYCVRDNEHLLRMTVGKADGDCLWHNFVQTYKIYINDNDQMIRYNYPCQLSQLAIEKKKCAQPNGACSGAETVGVYYFVYYENGDNSLNDEQNIHHLVEHIIEDNSLKIDDGQLITLQYNVSACSGPVKGLTIMFGEYWQKKSVCDSANFKLSSLSMNYSDYRRIST